MSPKRRTAKKPRPIPAGVSKELSHRPPSASAPHLRAGTRRRWFIVLALLAPIVLLAGLEAALRLAGFGYPTHFFLRSIRRDQPVWIENARFGWRFFPRRLARAPRPIVLPLRKAPGVRRIFVFGESAAMGDPQPAYGLPRMLRTLLEGRFPEIKFEVANAAMTAINSNVVLPIARDCAPRQGDLWVIYMGNNEVVGPFGAGTVFGAQPPNRTLLRASLRLKTTKIGQLLDALASRLAPQRSAPQTWQGMAMFLRRQVRADDARMAAVYATFERNLRDILRAAKAARAQVVVSTVATNLKDCAPFASLHRPDLSEAKRAQWQGLYQQAHGLMAAGKFEAALALLKQAEQIDSTYADLQFQMAQCERARGQFDEARQRYRSARDLDALRFRCDARLNGIIRAVAGNRTGEGIYLLDAARAFTRGSPHGLTGAEFFADHVHFDFEGNYLLAGLVAQETDRALGLAAGAARRPWPTMADCARRLALSGWDRFQLAQTMLERLQRPPFTNQLTHQAALDDAQTQLEKWRPFTQPQALLASTGLYYQALAAAPDDWVLHSQLAKLLETFGETRRAADEWRAVVQLVPQYAVGRFQLGRLLDHGADRAEAKRQLLQALRWWPDFPEARNSLGIVLAHESNFSGACRQFAAAVSLRPDYAEAELDWAMTLASAGRPAQALHHFSRAVALQPGNANARVKYGVALQKTGDARAAAAQFRQALRLDPGNRAAAGWRARAEGMLRQQDRQR